MASKKRKRRRVKTTVPKIPTAAGWLRRAGIARRSGSLPSAVRVGIKQSRKLRIKRGRYLP